MVKYLAEGQDFGPEHFAKEFGFTNSAYDDRATTNRRGRQSDGVRSRRRQVCCRTCSEQCSAQPA